MTRKTDSEQAAAVMRAAGLEPLVEYPGSIARWECRCQRCGRTVTPTYSHVRRGESTGCRYCSRRGVDASEAAVASAAALAAQGTTASSDLHAQSDYRQHLARVLTRRAVAVAARI